MLQRLAEADLVQGHTIGIDATTLEANAAMRSIVRRDTGAEYEAWLTQLAAASGIVTPTRAELARFDRKRKKKGSNDDWTHPKDPDAKITKLKDGRTHLAHTAEHAVDLETGAVVSVTVQDADDGDTTTMVETLITAAEQLAVVADAGLAEIVGDKGYHSNQTLTEFVDIGLRSYISEPDRGRRNWKGRPTPAPPSMPIGGGFEAPAGNVCCGNAANGLNGPMRISTTPAAPGASARTSQHPEALVGARLWVQSRIAHAAADRRRYAAEPPRPRGSRAGDPDRYSEPPLDPRSTLLAAQGARSARLVEYRRSHAVSRTPTHRFANRCFCHGLLGCLA